VSCRVVSCRWSCEVARSDSGIDGKQRHGGRGDRGRRRGGLRQPEKATADRRGPSRR
jgi:hypothetical protein